MSTHKHMHTAVVSVDGRNRGYFLTLMEVIWIYRFEPHNTNEKYPVTHFRLCVLVFVCVALFTVCMLVFKG